MKDFKDSTRTKYACGGAVKGPRGAAAVASSTKELKCGGTVKKPVRKQDGGAIGRANRMQALEAQEEAKLLREVPARPTRGNRPEYTTERPARTPRRSEKPETTPRRGPAGAGFATRPLYAPRRP